MRGHGSRTISIQAEEVLQQQARLVAQHADDAFGGKRHQAVGLALRLRLVTLAVDTIVLRCRDAAAERYRDQRNQALQKGRANASHDTSQNQSFTNQQSRIRSSQEPLAEATSRAMQDSMIRLKVGGRTAPHHPEHGRHSALPRSEDSAGQQDFHMLPHGARKDRCQDANGTAKGDRQGEHSHPFG